VTYLPNYPITGGRGPTSQIQWRRQTGNRQIVGLITQAQSPRTFSTTAQPTQDIEQLTFFQEYTSTILDYNDTDPYPERYWPEYPYQFVEWNQDWTEQDFSLIERYFLSLPTNAEEFDNTGLEPLDELPIGFDQFHSVLEQHLSPPPQTEPQPEREIFDEEIAPIIHFDSPLLFRFEALVDQLPIVGWTQGINPDNDQEVITAYTFPQQEPTQGHWIQRTDLKEEDQPQEETEWNQYLENLLDLY
jgi:hypothetical protein